MARKAKVAPVAVESTEVVAETVVEQEVVETNDTTTEPSLLASMLQQEVKPLEEAEALKETEVVAKVEKNIGVGQLVRKLIADGLTNTAILKVVHEQYGNTNTTYACVAWYRNKVKKAQALTAKSTAVEAVKKFLEPEIVGQVPTDSVAPQGDEDEDGGEDLGSLGLDLPGQELL